LGEWTEEVDVSNPVVPAGVAHRYEGYEPKLLTVADLAGKARSGDVGIVLTRNPDHVLGPDAVFITYARLPIRRSPKGYLETIPELIVEVKSTNDTLAALERKAQDYLQAGAVVV
jgi:Uma2 family endonuclease